MYNSISDCFSGYDTCYFLSIRPSSILFRVVHILSHTIALSRRRLGRSSQAVGFLQSALISDHNDIEVDVRLEIICNTAQTLSPYLL
jgi:hypothetical protein